MAATASAICASQNENKRERPPSQSSPNNKRAKSTGIIISEEGQHLLQLAGKVARHDLSNQQQRYTSLSVSTPVLRLQQPAQHLSMQYSAPVPVPPVERVASELESITAAVASPSNSNELGDHSLKQKMNNKAQMVGYSLQPLTLNEQRGFIKCSKSFPHATNGGKHWQKWITWANDRKDEKETVELEEESVDDAAESIHKMVEEEQDI